VKITAYESEKAILSELGERVKQYRISEDITQAELAERCGISLGTEARIENGEDSKISNYIKIMIELGVSENLDLLIPELEPDYKAMFEERPNRKRASKTHKKAESTWVWGEDKGE